MTIKDWEQKLEQMEKDVVDCKLDEVYKFIESTMIVGEKELARLSKAIDKRKRKQK